MDEKTHDLPALAIASPDDRRGQLASEASSKRQNDDTIRNKFSRAIGIYGGKGWIVGFTDSHPRSGPLFKVSFWGNKAYIRGAPMGVGKKCCTMPLSKCTTSCGRWCNTKLPPSSKLHNRPSHAAQRARGLFFLRTAMYGPRHQKPAPPPGTNRNI
jgi:hypothetical protein